MTRCLAIARRELLAFVLSPIGYVIIAVFMLFTALLYFLFGALVGGGFNQGEPASLQIFFGTGMVVFLFVGPAVSMRAISDELRAGTYEALMTSPVTEAQVVLGKFLGSMGFLVLLLVPTIIYIVALEWYGGPDYGEVLCGYAGLVLAGAAFLASGLLVSTLTSNQVVAYLVTLFFWLCLLLLTKGLPMLTTLLEGLVGADEGNKLGQRLIQWSAAGAGIFAAADPQARLRGFTFGLVDSFNVVYFLSLTGLFLIAAVKSLQMRRWR